MVAPVTDLMTPAERTTELWNRCYVASTLEEACAQAHRQFADFADATIIAHTLCGYVPGGDDWDHDIDFRRGGVEVKILGRLDNDDWDGDTLYPEWSVEPVDPDQIVYDDRGRRIRLGDIREVAFTAPGIGTAEGFAHQDPDALVYPL